MYMQWQTPMNDEIVIVKQLDDLKDQHRRLDAEIQAMQAEGENEIAIARLKKRKLQLRDMIMTLEVEIYPDVPA